MLPLTPPPAPPPFPISPGGPNNYEGVKIDYKGEDVNAETFLAVLAGDADAVRGKGSGKVVASGPRDRIFVFYSDHGAPGILGMPSGERAPSLGRRRRRGRPIAPCSNILFALHPI
jgi:hypothetical protein